MLRYLYKSELDAFPHLRDSMYSDRVYQFKTLLNWDVSVNDLGQEVDEYDILNPLYVIWEDVSGRHAGSMRLMPTTGRCMVNEYFTDLLGGGSIQSPFMRESTRFCLSRYAPRETAARLTLSAGEVMLGCGVEQCLGVFDQRMIRIYRLLGSSPNLIAQTGQGKEFIGIGLWTLDAVQREQICQIAEVEPQESEQWFFDKYKSTQSELLIVYKPFLMLAV